MTAPLRRARSCGCYAAPRTAALPRSRRSRRRSAPPPSVKVRAPPRAHPLVGRSAFPGALLPRLPHAAAVHPASPEHPSRAKHSWFVCLLPAPPRQETEVTSSRPSPPSPGARAADHLEQVSAGDRRADPADEHDDRGARAAHTARSHRPNRRGHRPPRPRPSLGLFCLCWPRS